VFIFAFQLTKIKTLDKIKETYLNALTTLCPKLTMAELAHFAESMTISELKNKSFYIKGGDIQKHIGFVYQGLLRAYYIDAKGNEITIRFALENTYATDYSAFINQEPSKYFIQCIEPSILVNLSYECIQSGYENFAGFERFGRLIAEKILKAQQKRIESFLFENAEERYLDFIKRHPDMFNRVSLSYLSSFLGIERPSLSRIRKKLAQK
jgi:CRP/FNR family transcriptional regulator, anaerobic regulatory protein